MIDQFSLFKEAIADAKARMQTELAWCKCPSNCMCDHCKPRKIALAREQLIKEFTDLGKKYEQFTKDLEKTVKDLENGKYPMRNQTHTLEEDTLDQIIKELEEALK